MATTEDAIEGLEIVLLEDFPVFLREVERSYTDGVELENLRAVIWEEYDDQIGLPMPGVMLLATDEVDESLRDQVIVSHITAVFGFADSNKRNLTKKMFRYGRALRRMLRPSANRSLRGRVISAKVGAIRWLPTGRNRSNLYARGFEADLECRLQRGGD